MCSSFSIGNINIGVDENPLVVPEMGINHEGSLEVAKLIVDAAHRAGAKIIKHQTHVVDDEMTDAAKEVIPGNTNKSIYEIMKQCALGEEEEWELKQYVESRGMLFLSTPFSRAAADRLERFGVLAYKIGSGELNNYPLIKHIANFGKPMIISTGMNDIPKIKKAVDIVKEAKVPYALMHTTNLYPTNPEFVRLGAMTELMETFPGIPVGLSDHTVNNTSCIAAMVLGASIVERHFVDDMNRKGPDIVCSMDENKCRELIKASQEIPRLIGGKKEAIEAEKVTMDFAFATVVTIKPIKSGEVFTEDNIWVKRPGTGEILAEEYEELIGKRSSKDIDCGVHLKRDMVVD